MINQDLIGKYAEFKLGNFQTIDGVRAFGFFYSHKPFKQNFRFYDMDKSVLVCSDIEVNRSFKGLILEIKNHELFGQTIKILTDSNMLKTSWICMLNIEIEIIE